MEKRVPHGEHHVIHCHSRSAVKWFYNEFGEMSKANLLEGKKNSLIFSSVKLSNTGYYWCYGRDVDTGQYFIAMSELQVLCKCN